MELKITSVSLLSLALEEDEILVALAVRVSMWASSRKSRLKVCARRLAALGNTTDPQCSGRCAALSRPAIPLVATRCAVTNHGNCALDWLLFVVRHEKNWRFPAYLSAR